MCLCTECIGDQPEPNDDQMVAIYLWHCLEYIREHSATLYEECGADQFKAKYEALLGRIGK